jgi:hypothetical protein
MQKKHGLILLAVGLPLLGMMGCPGLLVVAGAVAASQSDGEGRRERAMPNEAQPTVPSSPDTDSIARETDGGEDAPKPPAPVAFGGWSGGMPMGDSPNYVPSYDPMKSTAGTEEFGQMIRDQSSIQDTQTGEISHNVDNNVANPIVESGEATVVSPSATTESAPSGE